MPPAAYGPKIQASDDLTHPAFVDYANAVDVPVKAGDLLVLDVRLILRPDLTKRSNGILLIARAC